MADAHKNRPALLAAALTVLRAHIVAGFPCNGVLGSFDDWGRVVVGALLWLGEANPIETQTELAGEDPELARLKVVLQQWHALYGDKPMTISEVLHGEGTVPAFFDALQAVASNPRGGIDNRKLGTYIGRNKGRVADGRRFVPGKMRDGSNTWLVEPVV